MFSRSGRCLVANLFISWSLVQLKDTDENYLTGSIFLRCCGWSNIKDSTLEWGTPSRPWKRNFKGGASWNGFEVVGSRTKTCWNGFARGTEINCWNQRVLVAWICFLIFLYPWKDCILCLYFFIIIFHNKFQNMYIQPN